MPSVRGRLGSLVSGHADIVFLSFVFVATPACTGLVDAPERATGVDAADGRSASSSGSTSRAHLPNGGSSGSSGGLDADEQRDAEPSACTSDATACTGGDAGLLADSFAGCGAQTAVAKESPLDLYFMLDTSGSMDDLIGTRQSKWSAVVSAVTAFVQDPDSSGVGVGLQYFPLTTSGVPASCTDSAQCGSAGPCQLHACDFAHFTNLVPCDTSADCMGYVCNSIGHCSSDPNTLCLAAQFGNSCGNDPNGFDLGTCETVATSTCAMGDSCATGDYGTPAVAIGTLPGVAGAVTASLAARQPNGQTPTGPALQGALDEATSFAVVNAGHKVVVVLVTDGIPDECSPGDIPGIAQIAATALNGSPSIETFTVGILASSGAASGTTALNQVAAAGGTEQAFLVDSTSQDLAQQFAAALAAIRVAAPFCQYEVPWPDAAALDYGAVNVQFVSGSGTASTLEFVETASKCDPTGGGWYYDSDPAHGGSPSAIVACPATCRTIQSDAKGTVSILLGCEGTAK
jgi:Mg-chelatase subunit ChlD